MKHVLKVIAFGVCLGVALVIVQRVLQIDEQAFMQAYWIAAPAIVIGAMLINLFYNYGYKKRMRTAALLLEEGKIEEYIATVEAMLRTAKGKQLKNALRLNLSAGYCEQKQFDRAIRLLEELSQERLWGTVKMVHRLNLCACYFYTSQGEQAIRLYSESQKEFEPFRKSAAYGGNLAVIDMLAAIERKQYDLAEEMLRQAKAAYDRPRLQDDYRYIENALAEAAEKDRP